MTVPSNSYTGDGSLELFPITFGYLNGNHVFVTVDGVSTSFTFDSSTTVRISPAPSNGAVILIKRITPVEPEVVFQDTATVTAEQLNNSFAHSRYIAEETALGSGSGSAADAALASAKALEAAASASEAADSELVVLDAKDDVDTASAFTNTKAAEALASATAAASSEASVSADATAATAAASAASTSASTATAAAVATAADAATATTKAAEALASAAAAAANELNVLDATSDAEAAAATATSKAADAVSASSTAEAARDAALAEAAAAAASETAALSARDEVLDSLSALKVRSLRSFGAVGDTVIQADGTYASGTDDTVAIQAAFAWMNADPERALKGDKGDVHLVRSTITGTGHFNFDMGGCKFFRDTNVLALSWAANTYGPFDLTADYVKGAKRLYITSSALPVGVAPKGMVMKIASDAVDPGDRDEGSSSSQYRTAEFFVVAPGSALNWIEMAAPLNFTEGVSPTSVAGEEAMVDSYTQALNARVVYAEAADTFTLKNGSFQSEEGHEASWTNGHISVQGFIRPHIEGVSLKRGYGIGVKLSGTYQAVVKDCSAEHLENNTPNNQYGYGVADAGYGSMIDNLRIHDVRHGYTSGVAKAAADSSNVGLLLQSGRTMGATIRGGNASGGDNAPFDTHHSSDSVTFSDNFVDGSSGVGFSLRGRKNKVLNPRVVNSSAGCSFFTGYASGSPDDDFFNAGKFPEWVTSGQLESAFFECDALPIYNSYAFLRVTGSGRYYSQCHTGVVNQGGNVRFEGNHEFTTLPGGVSHSHLGCITTTPTNGAMVPVFSRTKVIIEGTVIIDATGSDEAGIYAFHLGNFCDVTVRGRLQIKLPAGASYASIGTGANLTCEGTGVIEVGIDGAADSSLFDPALMSGQRVKAIDGSAWWDDVADRRTPIVTAKDDDVGQSYSLTTSESATFTPSGQKFWEEMQSRGSGRARLRLTGRKTGTADSCRINIRSNLTNYVGYFEISSGHSWFELDVEVAVKGDGSYTFSGSMINQNTSEDESSTASKTRLLQKSETQVPTGTNNSPFNLTFQAETTGGDSLIIETYDVISDFGGQF